MWTNYGTAAATEKWAPGYKLVDFSGAVVRTLPATVDLKTSGSRDQPVSGDQPVPASATESVHIDLSGLPAGHYTLRASVEWQQHKPNGSHVVNYPPMRLARDGRDDSGLVSDRDAGRGPRRSGVRGDGLTCHIAILMPGYLIAFHTKVAIIGPKLCAWFGTAQ